MSVEIVYYQQLFEEAKALSSHVVALRRDFHSHPELSLQEFRTAQRIEEELDLLQIPHRRVGPTGVLGVIRGERGGGGIVALRADIDALPIYEVPRERSYCSQKDGVMHACGHDGHAAMLLTAAKLLVAHRADFGGEIRLIFQPAEEIGKGVQAFLAEDAVRDADRVFGMHSAPDLPCGVVCVKPGLNNAAVDQFTIRIQGKSSHVSTPQLGVDALYIASQIVISLQAIVTRLSSPVEPLLIGVGTLHAGTTYNALAESAVLEGTTRTVSLETRQRIRSLVEETAASISRLYGGEATLEWDDYASPVINDEEVCREAAAVFETVLEPSHIHAERPLSLSGDNMAELLLSAKGAYAYLGTASPSDPNTSLALHTSSFDIDERALPLGAFLHTSYALWWLREGQREK